MVASDIQHRYIIYGQPDEEASEITNEPIFRAARKGIMTWVREHMDWNPTKDYNMPLCEQVTKGTIQPDGHANIMAIRRRMRIIIGMRTGAIPGGPQHEGTFLKAAQGGTPFCKMAHQEGCRACIRKGCQNVQQETNMHCFLRCWSHSIGDQLKWCTKIIQHMKEIQTTVGYYKEKARDAHATITQAIACVRKPTKEGWQTVRQVVGGMLPRWNATVPPQLNKDIANAIEGLQIMFSDRLEEWSKYMAAYGAIRQGKWKYKGWMQLVFYALKKNATQPKDDTSEERRVSVEEWFAEEREIHTRLLHATRAMILYTRMIVRPQQKIEEQKRIQAEQKRWSIRRARYRIARILWNIAREERNTLQAAQRTANRGDNPSYRTRSLRTTTRINLDETKRQGKNRIKNHTLYKLTRWPHRDKTGWEVVRLLREKLDLLKPI